MQWATSTPWFDVSLVLGLFALGSVCFGRFEEHRPRWWRLLLGEGAFLRRYIFPDSELPPFLATARAAAGTGFELRDVESLREHYVTLRAWLSGLERFREEAIRAVGEGTFRAWRLYLAGSAWDFERAAIGVYQALYAKPEAGRSGLPLRREDWYRQVQPRNPFPTT